MNRPLFVHNDARVLDRISKESKGSALVTTSLVQALQWVTNPEVKISGAFISPEDTTFSAFRFLEITLTHRPALPIFLFEPHLTTRADHGDKIMKNTHVKGVFSGSEPYETLVASLVVQLPDTEEPRKAVPETMQRPGYVPLPITDFFTGTKYAHDVFILDPPNNLNLFAVKDSPIDPTYLSKAAKQVEFLYVKEDSVKRDTLDVKAVHATYLESDIPNSWKISESMAAAKQVLIELKNSGVNENLITYTETMLGDLFKLISKIESDEGAIHGMIEKAKQCDRSVFCASYSIMVCKQLKFEKTATLEILGLASILQDISLYKTEHGDLSEKLMSELSKEQLTVYMQHPTASADLVAHYTDVPQITLQVVRQQHERKDKSGFPNRVGGIQIHPMAEILSLINSYYEVSKLLQDDAAVIQELNKSVFSHYSDTVVTAFKTVLGNVLKDKAHAAKATV